MYNQHYVLHSQSCIAAMVRRAGRAVVGDYDRSLRPFGLTAAQLDLLVTLDDLDPPVRSIDLAAALHVDRSTLARNVRRLIDRGLIEANHGANDREHHLAVSVRGHRTLNEATSAWLHAQDTARQRLGSEGTAALKLLDQILTDEREENDERI